MKSNAFICPECSKLLSEKKNKIICEECNREYAIVSKEMVIFHQINIMKILVWISCSVNLKIKDKRKK